MRILVACEFSGIVREAFRARGHEAYSCDILPTEVSSLYHLQCDVRDVIGQDWDLLIAHPPCTYLCSSGARWMKTRTALTDASIKFAKFLFFQPIEKIALENPIGVLSTRLCEPHQIVQPWMFGHKESKATCLWLKNLPRLQPTHEKPSKIRQSTHMASPDPNRWAERSRTFPLIARAMANQWG